MTAFFMKSNISGLTGSGSKNGIKNHEGDSKMKKLICTILVIFLILTPLA
jgi:hypothetical protein